MEINKEITEEFRKITSKNIDEYFKRVFLFLQRDHRDIVSYYSGNTNTLLTESLESFRNIKKETDSVLSIFQLHSKRFTNVKWWILLEKIEEIESMLSTLSNIDRWSRSSANMVNYSSEVLSVHTLSQNQTLERLAVDQEEKEIDSWVDIAVLNRLREEDYSSEGGVPILLRKRSNQANVEIESVIDTMIGNNVYGKDLPQTLSFSHIENDLSTLSPEETLYQSVAILSKLKKWDNPDSPLSGIQSFIGNMSTLNFPVIERQMRETFATDDSLANFRIQTISSNQDNMEIFFEVETRLGETFEGSILT